MTKKLSKPDKEERETNYETQYFYGVKIVCKNWVPKNKVITISSPDEHGLQQVIIQQL